MTTFLNVDFTFSARYWSLGPTRKDATNIELLYNVRKIQEWKKRKKWMRLLHRALPSCKFFLNSFNCALTYKNKYCMIITSSKLQILRTEIYFNRVIQIRGIQNAVKLQIIAYIALFRLGTALLRYLNVSYKIIYCL